MVDAHRGAKFLLKFEVVFSDLAQIVLQFGDAVVDGVLYHVGLLVVISYYF